MAWPLLDRGLRGSRARLIFGASRPGLAELQCVGGDACRVMVPPLLKTGHSSGVVILLMQLNILSNIFAIIKKTQWGAVNFGKGK